MKRDGRTLDHKTLEEIRRLAVQRVYDGEKPSVVIASFGFSRTTIYKWLNAVAGRGRGLKSLRSTQATGRPRILTPIQERKIFHWIDGHDPRQYGFEHDLWTRRLIAVLIKQQFGIRLSVTTVGTLLARLGLTPQRPLQRANARDDDAIANWRKRFPTFGVQNRRSRSGTPST